MFGSLVVVLPAPHEGGTLILRHQEQQYDFDSAKIFEDMGDDATSHIAFVAFYSDVEHEVLPVTNGHRVTVTWNLYFGESKDAHKPAANLRMLQPPSANDAIVGAALEALLSDDRVLPEGGLLGFALRHEYPLDPKNPKTLHSVKHWLKGSDAALFAACEQHKLRPKLRFLVQKEAVYAICDRVPDLKGRYYENRKLWRAAFPAHHRTDC